MAFKISKKMKHYLKQTYYKESEEGLIKIEIIELTKNLVFFKYSINTENPKIPYDTFTKYRFLPEDEFDVYIGGFDQASKSWKQD